MLCSVFGLFGSFKAKAQKDIREESIYFLLTTRFFDGDTTNNAPTEWCSYIKGVNNPNITDPNDVTWKGDFKGLVQQLDYIKNMGFTAIWITPIVQNRSPLDYHGYHAWDFTKVDPRLESTGYTFKNLVDSVHAKGLKIFLDIVLNHAGRYGIKGRAEIKYNTDPTKNWGQDKNGAVLKDNPNWEYDGLTPNPDDGKIWSRANLAKMPAPYNQNLANYNWPSTENYVNTSSPLWYHHSGNGFAQGYDDTLNLYYRALAGDTPDLLTEGDSVRNYLYNAYKTFIDMGIDGLRLDAIKHMPKRDVLWFVDAFKKINPNLMIMGEVAQLRHELHSVEETNPHWYTWREGVGNSANSGIAVFDFYALGTFHLFEKGESYSNVKNAARYDYLYADPSTNIMFIDNHDFGSNNDWNRRFGGSGENLAAALNFMFTWRGLPCVYYGTETQFKKGVFADIKSSADLEKSIDNTGRAYYGNEIANAPNHTVYKHITKLNAMRNAIPALQKGDWRWDGSSNGNGVGFVRKFGASEVAVGLAKDGQVTFNFSRLTNGIYRDAVTGNEVTVSNGTLSFVVSPASAGVYVLNGTGIIGEKGTGYFQSTGSGGGGVPTTVSYNPQHPKAGQQVTVTYKGSLAGNSQLVMHYSFDSWTIGGINDINMTKNGSEWTVTVAVPATAKHEFVCVFNNGAGTWDNNNGIDYRTALDDGTSTIGIAQLYPANGAVAVWLGTSPGITFTENVKKGTGNILVYENGNLAQTIDVSSNAVSVLANTVSIQSATFGAGKKVHIIIPNGVFTDDAGNTFTGINSNLEWTFTTNTNVGIDETVTIDATTYPNPFSNGFILDVNKQTTPVNIQILNVLGKNITIQPEEIDGVLIFDMQQYPAGCYIVVLQVKGQTIRKKLIKQ